MQITANPPHAPAKATSSSSNSTTTSDFRLRILVKRMVIEAEHIHSIVAGTPSDQLLSVAQLWLAGQALEFAITALNQHLRDYPLN